MPRLAGSATAIACAPSTIAASLLLTAEVDGMVAAGVVRAPSVRWNKFSQDGRNANALTSDRLTDIGGGPTFYSCLVEVERCGD